MVHYTEDDEKAADAIDAIDATNADSDNRCPGFEVNGLLGSSDDRHKARSQSGAITIRFYSLLPLKFTQARSCQLAENLYLQKELASCAQTCTLISNRFPNYKRLTY